MAYDFIVQGVSNVDQTTLLATLRGALGNIILSVTLYPASGEPPYPSGAADVLIDAEPENTTLESQVVAICTSTKSVSATVLANDEFTIPQPNPLDALRNCNPGPGQIITNDPGGFLSISTEQILATQGDVAGTTYAIGTTAIVPGQALLLDNPKFSTTGRQMFGFIPDGNWRTIPGSNILNQQRGAWDYNGGNYYPTDGSASVPVGNLGGLTTRRNGIGLARSVIGEVLVFENSQLLWIDDLLYTDTLYPIVFYPFNAAVDPTGVGNYRAVQLTDRWLTDIATVNIPTPVLGLTYPGTDFAAWHQLNFTLPSAPVLGDKAELDFRYQDSQNYFAAYLVYNGASWDLKIDKIIGGVTTNLFTTAGIAAQAAFRVYNHADNNFQIWTQPPGGSWFFRAPGVTDAALTGVLGLQVNAINSSIDRLKSWPRTQPAYNALLASHQPDSPAFIFGDGSDGDATISQNVTLTRDMFFENLTITATGNLNPGGFRIYVHGKLSIAAGGKISARGGDAGDGSTGATGGAAGQPAYSSGGTLPAGAAGQAGVGASGTGTANGATVPSAITNFSTITAPDSIMAGGGGAGGSAHGTGFTSPTQPVLNCGSRGGNGGAATGVGTSRRTGGGGGAGGGHIEVYTHEIDNNGVIDAGGGNGGNGVTSTDASGNGGGGAGGFIAVYYHFPSGTNGLGSLGAIGGLAGTAGNGGTNGADGVVVWYRV